MNYLALARATVGRLADQDDAIDRAAGLVVDAFRAGGILQVYGTGHSRAVTLEMAGRAGGLVPVNMLAVKDLVMFGGEDPARILDPTYEREPGLAERIWRLAGPRPGDAFLIVSNSGINPAIVEMAQLARDGGHPLVAITSVAHTGAVASRDATGRRLADLADVVLDNTAPAGDAALEPAPGIRIGAVSSLAGVLLAQLLTERICRRMLDAGERPPVYLSSNLPAGDAHNAELIDRYADRVRPIEP